MIEMTKVMGRWLYLSFTRDSKESMPWENKTRPRRREKHFISEFRLFAQIVAAIWAVPPLKVYFF
jgi:hypothetical protein